MKIVREGQKFEYDIFSAGLMLPFGITAIPELEELDIATASDNGNSVRVEPYVGHRYAGTLTAGAPCYADVTTVVAKRDGDVLSVFGEQFYVARAEQGDIADGELPVREITQARAAAVTSTEAHTESVAAPQTNSPDAATNEFDENSESAATV